MSRGVKDLGATTATDADGRGEGGEGADSANDEAASQKGERHFPRREEGREGVARWFQGKKPIKQSC